MPSVVKTHASNFTATWKRFNSNGTLHSQGSQSFPNPGNRWSPRYQRLAATWGVTANYKTLRETQGYLPTQPLTVERLYASNWGFDTNVYRTSPQGVARYEIVNGPTYFPQDSTYCENQGASPLQSLRGSILDDAKYKALQKARDLRLSLPVLFGEGRQTVRMFQDASQRLFRSYSAFRKGRFKKAAKELGINRPSKAAADNWLAYQYGWRPVLNDMVNSATFLYDYVEGNGKWRPRFTASHRVEDPEPKSVVTATGTHVWVPSWTYRYEMERTIVARAGLLLQMQHEISAAAASLGVGLYDPLLTAWELTPFSFVFDWVVDVGSWLEARSSLQGLNVLTGYQSVQTLYKGVTVSVPPASGGYRYTDNPTQVHAFRVVRYSRSSWNGGITQLRLPLWDGLNATRLTTSAALARQLLKGDRSKGDPYPLSPATRGRR